MNIDRSDLVRNLRQFLLSGHGLVVGSPGVGKTFCVGELAASLLDEGRPCVTIPVGDLADATPEALLMGLGIQQDPIQQIRQEFALGPLPGAVIVDSYDAARDPVVRSRVQQLIQRLVLESQGQWYVLVTCRSYDARKSPDLLALFPQAASDGGKSTATRRVRQFEIPLLTASEIDGAMQSVPGWPELRLKATPEFLKILHTPFNLRLVESILEAQEERERSRNSVLSGTESEIELLQSYWECRVINVDNGLDRTAAASALATNLFQRGTMTTSLAEVYDRSPASAWRDLLSAEVTVSVGRAEEAIAFSHNILFDYAVSLYVLDGSATELLQVLRDRPSLTLFLRPSLVYYFANLWHNVRGEFWRTFEVFRSNSIPAIRLIGRLVPARTIAEESRHIEDMAEVLRQSMEGDVRASECLLLVFQAVMHGGCDNADLWANVVAHIAERPNPVFAWQAAEMLDRILLQRSESPGNETDSLFALINQASRHLMDWIWSQKMTDNVGLSSVWLDNFASARVIPLVMRTANLYPDESVRVLRPILQLIGQENFPIRYVYALCDHLDQFYVTASEFVGEVYEVVFGYHEDSSAKVHFGGIVLPMSSTRRQEYEICQYTLARSFNAFLANAPAIASRSALRVVTASVIRNHRVSILPPAGEGSLENKPEEITFRGCRARVVADGSAFWGAHSRDDTMTLLRALTQRLVVAADALGTSGDRQLLGRQVEILLDAFAQTSVVAVQWGGLLAAGTKSPKILASYLYELCLQRSILSAPDLVRWVAQFLELAPGYWTDEQRAQVELKIFELPTAGVDEDRLGKVRDELLKRIPEQLLITEQVRRYAKSLDRSTNRQSNMPGGQLHAWSTQYTEDDVLIDQGVDLADPQNMALRQTTAPLQEFVRSNRNQAPSNAQINAILPRIQDALNVVHSHFPADGPVLEESWTLLAGAAAIVARANPGEGSEERRFIRSILLEAIRRQGVSGAPDANSAYTTAYWISSPQSEAIQGLGALSVVGTDRDIISAIQDSALTVDQPSWRLLAVRVLPQLLRHSPDEFQRIAGLVVAAETNSVVLATLLITLRYTCLRYPEFTMDILRRIVVSPEKPIDATIAEPFASLLVLLADHDNKLAIQFIEEIYDAPFGAPVLFEQVVLSLASRITLEATSHRSMDPQSARLLAIGLNAVGDSVADQSHRSEADSRSRQDLLQRVVADVSARLRFNSKYGGAGSDGVDFDPSEPDELLGSSQGALLRNYWSVVRPMIESILRICAVDRVGGMSPTAAHDLMQLLTYIVRVEPRDALNMSASIVVASAPYGYNLDSAAVSQVVIIAETILADHQEVLLEPACFESMISLLAAFSSVGWSAALDLVWRLDAAFR